MGKFPTNCQLQNAFFKEGFCSQSLKDLDYFSQVNLIEKHYFSWIERCTLLVLSNLPKSRLRRRQWAQKYCKLRSPPDSTTRVAKNNVHMTFHGSPWGWVKNEKRIPTSSTSSLISSCCSIWTVPWCVCSVVHVVRVICVVTIWVVSCWTTDVSSSISVSVPCFDTEFWNEMFESSREILHFLICRFKNWHMRRLLSVVIILITGKKWVTERKWLTDKNGQIGRALKITGSHARR